MAVTIDLPPARPRLARPQHRLPHGAGERRQSVRHARRSFLRRRDGADARQPHRQDRAHPARRQRRRPTIRSSASRARCRKSGPMACATRKASPSIRPTASCGSRSTARRAATRSTSSRRARTTAGRWSSYGVNYDGTPVGAGKAQMAGMVEPVWHWTPSIAPSGMAFYTGDLFPGWKGSLINGALKFELLSRLDAQRRQGREGRTPAARPARAHPRRAAGAGRRALSAHRQWRRPHSARRRRRNRLHHL